MDWYKRDVDAALNGMAVLDLEERGAYNGVLDMLYSRDGDLADDDELIARTLRVNPRTWRSVKVRLIAHGKIWVTSDAKIGAKRVEKTLNEARNYSETQSKRARKGWQTRKNDNKNNAAVMPSGNANTLTTTSTIKEEDTNVSSSKKRPPKKPLALDDEMLAWVKINCPGIDPAHELRKHLDWKASKGRTYRDDRAAFRNWCSNAQERFNNQGGRHGPSALFGGKSNAYEFSKSPTPSGPPPKIETRHGLRVVHE